jgi:succinoglycan biosynthesis transport protein ExoP
MDAGRLVSQSLSPVPAHVEGRATVPLDDGRQLWQNGATTQTSAFWRRYLAAVRRYKWLMALVVLAAAGVGYLAARRVQPEYIVNATIWIAPETQQGINEGPIRADNVLRTAAWPELATSLAILDRVARRMALYVAPHDARDAPLFVGAGGDAHPRPGQYVLRTDAAGRRYVLALVDGPQVETGVPGDSVGRSIGLQWRPSAAAMRGREVRFSVFPPRQAALGLRGQLTASLPDGSNLLRLSLTGTDPPKIAATLQTLVDEYIAQAQELKKRNLVEVTRTLRDQLDVASKDLRAAEQALEAFRVRTITLPTEAMRAAPTATPTTAGTAPADAPRVDPITQNFYVQQETYESARRERMALERTLAGIRNGSLDLSALSAFPAARVEPSEVQHALQQHAELESQLAAARRQLTDAHPKVVELVRDVKQLREVIIPRHAAALVTQLRMRENDLGGRVASTAQQLRGIPVRSIEEARLRRNTATRENLYGTLKSRYEESKLAEASAMPDVSVLDTPVAPEHPSSDRKPFVVALAVLIGVALAGLLAFALDRLDPRFRYAEQATEELGLDIIGVVPAAHPQKLRDPQQAMQLVEAFRSIRLNVAQAADASGKVIVTVASPNAGDGKSMVSANLALSFAEAGYRTLLVDGDIRRGALDKRFEVERAPGLLDYLNGTATLDQTLRESGTDKLWLIPRGAPQARGSELLMTPIWPDLIAELQRQFEAVIVDSAPLGAGIDPFVLGAATVNMLLVFRAGESNRRLAQAKLKLLSRLPIHLLGVVLNDVSIGGDFQYYAYSYRDPTEPTQSPELETQLSEFARRSGLSSTVRK